jgi:hypothetical protein
MQVVAYHPVWDRWVGEKGGGKMIDDGNVCEGDGWRTGGGTG